MGSVCEFKNRLDDAWMSVFGERILEFENGGGEHMIIIFRLEHDGEDIWSFSARFPISPKNIKRVFTLLLSKHRLIQ